MVSHTEMARTNKIRRKEWIALDAWRVLIRGPPKKVLDRAESVADATRDYTGITVYEVIYERMAHMAPPDLADRLFIIEYSMNPYGEEWNIDGPFPHGYGPVLYVDNSGYRTRWARKGGQRYNEPFLGIFTCLKEGTHRRLKGR